MADEWVQGQLLYNRPAGTPGPNETLAQAAMRNTLEEIGRGVILSAALGISRYRAPANGVTYLRDCFLGQAGRQTNQALDEGIEHARRLTIGQMQARTARLRSPVVITGVLQYLNGSRHPLNLIF